MKGNNGNGVKESVSVAKLDGDKAPYPYTSLSSSPNGNLILIAGKDTVRFVSVTSSGLKEVKSVRISQFFQATRSVGLVSTYNAGNASNVQKKQELNDVFVSSSAQGATSTNIAINITDVAWSLRQHNDETLDKSRSRSYDYTDNSQSSTVGDTQKNEKQVGPAGADMKKDPFQSIISMPDDLLAADDSFIAAAGSNGVVVVWHTCDMLGRGLGDNGWNMKGSNLFGGYGGGSGNTSKNNFSRENADRFLFLEQYMNHQRREGGWNRRDNSSASSTTIGNPEVIIVEHNRAVNCIAWHRRKSGIFLTASQDGTVKMFERREMIVEAELNSQKQNNQNKWRWFAKSTSSTQVKSYRWHYTGCFKPNCGSIRDIQWSHCNDDLFAMVTNNGYLVVHSVNIVNNGRSMIWIPAHVREATTLDWHPIEPYIIATGSVGGTVKVWDLESEISFDIPSHVKQNSNSVRSHGSFDSGSFVSGESSPISHHENDQLSQSYHGPNSSSSTTAISSLTFNASSTPHLFKPRVARNAAFTQLHELSVSAQVEKIKWRPPKTGSGDRSVSNLDSDDDHHAAMLAVATSPASGAASGGHGTVSLWSYHRPFMPLSIVDGHKEGAVTDFIWLDTPEAIDDDSYALSGQDEMKLSLAGTWQHVLSIGKDGRCIVQSFARGERPLSEVSPSAFAIANLSPFQHGFGSLQIISAHQKVPSGQNNDYLLSGLRRDELTSLAPGFYKEDPPSDDLCAINKYQCTPNNHGQIESSENVDLYFNVTDCGALDELFSNSSVNSFSEDEVKIAPEVVHLSRFAEGYKICTDSQLPTKAAVCRFNAAVAMTLQCEGHSRMWNILASILEGSGYECISVETKKPMISSDAMSFILYPTLKSLLLERADAGDVQTCVVLCEVLEVVMKQRNNTVSVVVPGIDLILVRQWYLSYIEILQQMCLFSHAAHLIGNCKDPEIGKLNQTSTTIHEACPICAKPLQPGQKSCRSCRRKVGLCFLCHEPVTGIYVMCPGCGHGGHLEHALQWFTSLDNKFHELCPTGCGHKCNFITLPKGSHFPRTESLQQLQFLDS